MCFASYTACEGICNAVALSGEVADENKLLNVVRIDRCPEMQNARVVFLFFFLFFFLAAGV